jgi:adenine/guanine phosphoribosyltransferase-like PRPP-binding protein
MDAETLAKIVLLLSQARAQLVASDARFKAGTGILLIDDLIDSLVQRIRFKEGY